jgi:phosphoribosylaminoimidazolecarboxamide formyltransferase/IMP cyclohydrolase
VKTLHPKVHGGLLARRDVAEHVETVRQHGIPWIDLVAVNLYPFRETAATPGIRAEDVVEQIDIGGPSMLRSAAKNFAAVTVVCDPADYDRVLDALRSGEDALDLRRELAAKVYGHTGAYDMAIAAWFADQRGEEFPGEMGLALTRARSLRYGENPEQRAAFYVERRGAGLDALVQHGGKELSFNNLLDLEGALLAADAFRGRTCCAIIKHTTPCGLAVGATPLDAYRKALACDPVSAFGSVIAFNVAVDDATAEAVAALFVECIVAPAYTPGAIETLARKKNLRVLEGTADWPAGALDFKRVRGGFLVQDRALPPVPYEHWRVVTNRQPSDAERQDLLFAWQAVGSVKSNAIVLARNGATIGIGAGQMSRVDSVRLSLEKCRLDSVAGAVLASDAFFPFADGPELAIEAGVTAVMQPGGSVHDDEVVAAAEQAGISMVMTHKRHFRH